MKRRAFYNWVVGALAAGLLLYGAMLTFLMYLPRIGCCPVIFNH
jgi:hypothetical protein